MKTVQFAARADRDFNEILLYTQETWGEAQAIAYLELLQDSCEQLASMPGLGRACNYIRPDLRRFEAGSHVIFYRQVSTGIRVGRILHKRTHPKTQTF